MRQAAWALRGADRQGLGAEVTGFAARETWKWFAPSGQTMSSIIKEDFTQQGRKYDLILTVNGFRPISDDIQALKNLKGVMWWWEAPCAS